MAETGMRNSVNCWWGYPVDARADAFRSYLIPGLKVFHWYAGSLSELTDSEDSIDVVRI